MATRSWSSFYNLAGDTEFRQWAQGVSDTFTAFLVKTADTGQIANPIVAVRPAINSAAGYEVFRFDDTHQPDYPLFIKVEYGVGSTQTIPTIWITVGTGSDGAGAITGVRLARLLLNRGAPPTAGVSYEHAASGGDGWFALAMALGSTTGLFLLIDRNRDINGDPTADCVFLLASPSSGSTLFATLPPAPATAVSINAGSSGVGPPVLFAPSTTTEISNRNGEVPIFPIEPFLGRRQPPLLVGCVVHNVDVGVGVVFQTVMYGSTKTFRRISDGFQALVRGTSQAAVGQSAALAIRWE